MSFLEPLVHIASIGASIATILAPAVAFSTGLVPRIGPMRAVALALRSRFASADRVSLRHADIMALKSSMAVIENSASSYIVVRGPKGVGKTCLIDTVLQRTCGVVYVQVGCDHSEKDVFNDALCAIARVRTSFFVDPLASARRVIFFYSLFLGRPTVVLQIAERPENKDFASVTGPVRQLVKMGLRVILDTSDNSLTPGVLTTERQMVLEIEPMPRTILESIPTLAALHTQLKDAGLDDIVWCILGGSPAAYERLDMALAVARISNSDMQAQLTSFLQKKLIDAIHQRVVFSKYPELVPLILRFKTEAFVPEKSVQTDILAMRPTPDKVLRTVTRDGEAVLVPSDAAMALVLHHDLEKAPSLEGLRSLVLLSGTGNPN